MTITLQLKIRTSNNIIQIEGAVIHRIMKMSEPIASRQLYKMFNGLEESVHDKGWLVFIVNWVPKEGLPMTKVLPWLKLAERVDNLSSVEEESFVLSDAQADLIYKRLTSDDFIMIRLDSAFASFLLDFLETYGKRPDVLTDEIMFDKK